MACTEIASWTSDAKSREEVWNIEQNKAALLKMSSSFWEIIDMACKLKMVYTYSTLHCAPVRTKMVVLSTVSPGNSIQSMMVGRQKIVYGDKLSSGHNKAPNKHRHTHSGLKTGTQGWWLTISRGGCVSPRADPIANSAVDVLSINAKVTSTIRPLSFSQWTCVVANCRCASSHFNYTGCVLCNYPARVLITPALTCSCHWAICVCVTVCGPVCARLFVSALSAEWKHCILFH